MLSQMHAHLRAHAVAASAAAFTARRGVPQRLWAPPPSLSRPARRLAGARSRGSATTTGTGVVLGAVWWLLCGAFEVVVFLFQITVGAFYRLMKY